MAKKLKLPLTQRSVLPKTIAGLKPPVSANAVRVGLTSRLAKAKDWAKGYRKPT